jgi:hypothetical protein
MTDVVISFNWDTILDRVLKNRKNWHPAWGYGQTVREEFECDVSSPPGIPKKYLKLLKLHGSINWAAYESDGAVSRVVAADWQSVGHVRDVVMMPPKMIKQEVWGRQSSGDLASTGGNKHISNDFYPSVWEEAEQQLSRCRRIVFIGYSFPPADFAVGNLLRRSISTMKVSTGQFPAVDIVDPHAADLASRFKQSFKIEVPIENQYLSLSSYLQGDRAL